MDHMKSFPSFTNPSKAIDTSSERIFFEKNILGTIDIAPITEKNTNVGYKIQQISWTFTREFIGIVLNNILMTIHDSLRITFMRAWKFFGARAFCIMFRHARAHFTFFRADMNLVCTKCNGARVSVWWTRAHKCDGWSYINMIDGCKKTYKKCARTNTIRAHAQISYGRVYKYHTCEHTNITQARTQILYVSAQK